jgi:hypothetical protein
MKTKLLPLLLFLIVVFSKSMLYSQEFPITAPTAITCPTCTGNLILNSDFELGSNTAITSWTKTAGNAIIVQGTLVNTCASINVCPTPGSTTQHVGAIGNPSGSYTGAGTSTTHQDVTLAAGTMFNFNVYAGRTDPSCTPTIKLIFLNSANTEIAGQSQTISVVQNAYQACALALYNYMGTAPVGTTKIRIELNTTCGYLKVDAMCLTTCKNAGTNGNATICDNSNATIDLNSKIGVHDTGGTWSKTGGTGSVSAAGIFTPLVGGGAATCDFLYKFNDACADNSTVRITVIPKANAGTDKTYTVCSNAITQINLNDILTDEQANGAWTLAGNPVTNMYTPTSGTVVFTYTITGTSPCANDISTVTVTVTPKANAGTDKTYTVCSNAITQIDLNSILTDEQPNGIWSLAGNNVSNLYTPTSGTVVFTYTINGTSPCVNDISTVTVTVTPKAMTNAGDPFIICANVAGKIIIDEATGLPIVNTAQLNGSVSGGATSGTWSDGGAGGTFSPNATTLNAIYTPPFGVEVTTLTLTSNDPDGPCGPASSTVTVTQKPCSGILDPCTCNDVTYNDTETLEVKDFIEIDGTPGRIWTIKAQSGMQTLDNTVPLTTTNILFPIGTVIPETPVGSGKYILNFAHDQGVGYTVTVTDGVQDLSINNLCFIKNFVANFAVPTSVCINSTPIPTPIPLSAVILNGTTPLTPAEAAAAGTVRYYYVNSANTEVNITEFNPLDPNYPIGTPIQIYSEFIPAVSNIIDCNLIRKAQNPITLSQCALSVTLLKFDAKVINDAIGINWKTADEKDFSHFEIMKSSDAKEFAVLGTISANNSKYYNFTDNNPTQTLNYYRLKMVNNDGSFDMSKVISVIFETGSNFVNVENPAKNGEFMVSTSMKNPSFTLLTSNGSKIEATVISNGMNKFIVKPINNVSGLYFLNIVSDNKVVTKKVIIP